MIKYVIHTSVGRLEQGFQPELSAYIKTPFRKIKPLGNWHRRHCHSDERKDGMVLVLALEAAGWFIS
jgi:hypothetical protein